MHLISLFKPGLIESKQAKRNALWPKPKVFGMLLFDKLDEN